MLDNEIGELKKSDTEKNLFYTYVVDEGIDVSDDEYSSRSWFEFYYFVDEFIYNVEKDDIYGIE